VHPQSQSLVQLHSASDLQPQEHLPPHSHFLAPLFFALLLAMISECTLHAKLIKINEVGQHIVFLIAREDLVSKTNR